MIGEKVTCEINECKTGYFKHPKTKNCISKALTYRNGLDLHAFQVNVNSVPSFILKLPSARVRIVNVLEKIQLLTKVDLSMDALVSKSRRK